MSWSLTCSFLFILLDYSCDTRELAIASTCQWREDVDAGNWKCYSRMRFCSRTGCLKHVFIDTQFQGAETCFKDCMWWCCVSWGGLYQTSCLDGLRHFFLVLCSVCVHDESNLVSLQNQGADFVNAVWVLSKCIAQENFNTLDNICSLHICLHMPWFYGHFNLQKTRIPSSLRQQSIPLWSGRLFKQWKRMCSVWMQCWCSGSVVLSHPDVVGVFGAVSELKSLKIPSEDTFAYEMNSFWTTAELRHIETWRLVLYLCAANISSCGDYVGSM